MKHLLIDHDGKIPNLALLQLSAWLKSQGHETGLNINNPDEVWVSCIFKKNREQALGLKTMYDCPIHYGGSGIYLKKWLPEEAQKITPDYDLYPNIEYSMGFTTRGCIRNCDFCVVPTKEGRLHRWQHISEFHNPRFKTIMLLDNNILADRVWFFENTQYLIDNKLKLIEHGMDIRIITDDIAKRLKDIKWGKPMKFAWDNVRDEKIIKRGIDICKKADINMKNNAHIYVLVGFNTTPKEDIYRCQKLKEWGVSAFVMPYKKTKFTKALSRWANRKENYWTHDFKDYRYGDWTEKKYQRIMEIKA